MAFFFFLIKNDSLRERYPMSFCLCKTLSIFFWWLVHNGHQLRVAVLLSTSTIPSDAEQFSATLPGLSGTNDHNPALPLAPVASTTWPLVFFPYGPQSAVKGDGTWPRARATRIPLPGSLSPGPELDHVVCRCHWSSFSSQKELSWDKTNVK